MFQLEKAVILFFCCIKAFALDTKVESALIINVKWLMSIQMWAADAL